MGQWDGVVDKGACCQTWRQVMEGENWLPLYLFIISMFTTAWAHELIQIHTINKENVIIFAQVILQKTHDIHSVVISILKVFIGEVAIVYSISAKFFRKSCQCDHLLCGALLWSHGIWDHLAERERERERDLCSYRTMMCLVDWLSLSSPMTCFIGFLFSKSGKAEIHISH